MRHFRGRSLKGWGVAAFCLTFGTTVTFAQSVAAMPVHDSLLTYVLDRYGPAGLVAVSIGYGIFRAGQSFGDGIRVRLSDGDLNRIMRIEEKMTASHDLIVKILHKLTDKHDG